MHLSETGHNGVGAFSAGIKTNATIQFDVIRNDSAKHGLVFFIFTVHAAVCCRAARGIDERCLFAGQCAQGNVRRV